MEIHLNQIIPKLFKWFTQKTFLTINMSILTVRHKEKLCF